MKGQALLVLIAIIEASGYLIKVPTAPVSPKTSTAGWVHLQKLILPLFDNVCEDSTNPIILRLSQEFTADSTSGVYLKPEVITNLQDAIVKGLLPKGQIFTNYESSHVKELKTIYDVFVYAKDFDTFYKAAAWARQNTNCGLFVNALYLAVLNRRDTEKITVPAPYEILPNYFIEKDVIVKASQLLSGEEVVLNEVVRDEGNSYIFDANYTGDYNNYGDESVIAYFHEDIGLNTYYFLQKLKRSPWFNTNPETSVRYGEYLYHTMKQLSARYDLERYANGLTAVESLNFGMSRVSPYDPKLIYSNGNDFGHRTTPVDLIETDNVELLQTIENSLETVVVHMRDTGYNKSEILNHLMEILVTSDKSFENLLRTSIAKDTTFTKSQPSVLDHYMTSLRDPVFWKINKKIVELTDSALKALPVYTRNELYFPGVEILNVDVKKMMTTCESFQFDVTDALKTTTSTGFSVKINQPRLNHKPFVMKLNISSIVTSKGLVKIYLGPKVAPGQITSKKNQFMLLDSFEYNFKVGKNIVSRSSEEMQKLSDDFISFKTLRKNVEDAEFGIDAAPLKNIETLLGFPSRLILPRGTPEGLPLQIFVFIAPFVKPSFGGIFSIQSEEFNSEILSPGFLLDLELQDHQLFDLPNAFVKDIIITGKEGTTSAYKGYDGTKKWQGSAGPKPDYSMKKKEPYDYSAKKGQYGKKTEDKSKRVDYSTITQDTTDQHETDSDEDFNKKYEFKEEGENYKVSAKPYTTTEMFDTSKTQVDKDYNKFDSSLNTLDKFSKVDLEKENSLTDAISGDKDLLPFLTSTYPRIPSVYDYLMKPDDFYDEVNVDDKLYE